MLLIVVAHYDDEVIAASSRLGPDCRILHVTDSGPRNPKYFTRAGFDRRETYAAHRRHEMLQAVSLAGMTEAQCDVLEVPDQEATRQLPFIAQEIARRLGYKLVDHRLELYGVPLDDKAKAVKK